MKTVFKLYRSFSKISFVSAGNILSSLIGFLYLTAAAKTLTLEDFGKYSLITSLLVSISKLIDFGTNSLYVAKSISSDNDEIKDFFYSLKVLLSVVTVPVSFIALKWLNVFDTNTFILFTFGLVSYGISYTLYALFQKNEMYSHLVAISLMPALIKGIAATLLFSGLIQSSVNLLFGIFGLSIFSTIILFPLLPQQLRRFTFHTKNSFNMLKEAISPGVSLMVYEAWPAVNNSIAKITSGFGDVGVFSLANKISNIFYLISISIFTVLLPRNAARKKRKLNYDFKESATLALLILIMSFAAVAIAETFVSNVFGEKFENSIGLLDILIFASAITAIQNFIENYFYVEQKTSYLGSINVIRLITFLFLSFLFVPSSLLKGLAYANLTSAILGLLVTVTVIKKLEGKSVKI